MAAKKPRTPKTSSKTSKEATHGATDNENGNETDSSSDTPDPLESSSSAESSGEPSMLETLMSTVLETLRPSTAAFKDNDAAASDGGNTSDADPSEDDQEVESEPVMRPIPERTPYVVVVTGNAPLDSDAVARVPDGAIVLAADGGLDFALASGLRPAALIGDLDSVSPAGLAWAEANANVQRFPTDKDQTDTELALAVAADFNPDHLILIAGEGDRLDHTVTALGALGQASLASVPIIEAWWGDQHLYVVQGPGRVTISTSPGMTISVVATHGACEGVTLEGVRWPLIRADLAPLSGLGVSNEALADSVEIAVSSGVLTVFLQPAILRPSDRS